MQQLNFEYLIVPTPDLVEVRIKTYFDQDDLPDMATGLIHKIEGSYLVETIEGADRVCYRLALSGKDFALNFDTYSQSCWFESEDPQDLSILEQIAQFLSR